MDIRTKTVLYTMPGTEAVTVRSEKYADDLTMDIYSSPASSPLVAVVIVAGYPDPGYEKHLGCKFKDMGSSVSWARLFAASGLTAITYTNREPARDLGSLLSKLEAPRLGLFATSANVPLALSLLISDAPIHPACAALCYGYMLDLDGSTAVAEASKKIGFANPSGGTSVA